MSIEMLAHRGLWCRHNGSRSETIHPQNSLAAFRAALELGFGIETDIRDCLGELVIEHDLPTGKQPLLCKEFFDLYVGMKANTTLALNIKADGLVNKLQALLEDYQIKNYFVFDMSFPQALLYHRVKFNFYTRQSDYELHPYLYEFAQGVWLDQFEKPSNPEQWTAAHSIISSHISHKKQLTIVSPELHPWGKEYNEFTKCWSQLKQDLTQLHPTIVNPMTVKLCTDFPELAQEFFQ